LFIEKSWLNFVVIDKNLLFASIASTIIEISNLERQIENLVIPLVGLDKPIQHRRHIVAEQEFALNGF
jgi:hypothetical protein